MAISGDAATDLTLILTLTPTSLTFTPSNWNRPQRVTITAPEDTDFIGATITLTHTASGADYGGLTPTVVTVTVVAAHPREETKAWQLRLGRTVSHQVVDALQDRLSTPPGVGLQLTVAGKAIVSASPLAEHEGLLSKGLGFDPLTAPSVGGGLLLQPGARARGSSTPSGLLGARRPSPPSVEKRKSSPWMGI